MKIVITGGTGFVGRVLTDLAQQDGHEIIILTRGRPREEDGIRYVQWLVDEAKPEEAIGHADAFVNLAGVSINDGRWSESHRRAIYDSRMEATDEVLRIMRAMKEKPDFLVNASAVGIYPASEDTIYTEQSAERDTGILGTTVADWEKKAAQAETDGIRTVFTRFATVFGKDEGALPLLVLPYKLFAGGKIGSGRQWVSWVHVEDVARAILFAINTPDLHGPVNVSSPFPKRMSDTGKAIAGVLHRPYWFPVPGFMMKLALGDKSALVLEGQHVLPQKLQNAGFEFKYPVMEDALRDLLA